MKWEHGMIVAYVLVIILATTLHEPWLIAAQAAAGGIAIGWRLERLRARRVVAE